MTTKRVQYEVAILAVCLLKLVTSGVLFCLEAQRIDRPAHRALPQRCRTLHCLTLHAAPRLGTSCRSCCLSLSAVLIWSSRWPRLMRAAASLHGLSTNVPTWARRYMSTASPSPPDVPFKVFDIISNAPASATSYDDLKKAVLKELLSKEVLGDAKPSDLLRRMKKMLGDKYDAFHTNLFHHLYYQRFQDCGVLA